MAQIIFTGVTVAPDAPAVGEVSLYYDITAKRFKKKPNTGDPQIVDAVWEDTNNMGIGEYALYERQVGTTASGTYNVAIGKYALNYMKEDDSNVAIGYGALGSLTVGDDNIAIGAQALVGLTSGTKNIALGTNTLNSLGTGNNNVAIGYGILDSESSGSNNTAIGVNALGAGVTASGNVCIGYNAGATETESDKLHIANNSIESLIQGDFVEKTVTINGSLEAVDGIILIDTDVPTDKYRITIASGVVVVTLI